MILKLKIKFIFGILISGVCVAVAIYRIDFQELLNILKNVRPAFLLLSVAFILLTQIIRSLRWQLLMMSVKWIRLMNLTSATVIGSMADMILPARVGDIIRAGLIGKREKVSSVSSLATIVVERTYDILTILFVLLMIVLFFNTIFTSEAVSDSMVLTGKIVTVASLMLLLLLFVIRIKTTGIIHLLNRFCGFLPERFRARIAESLASFALGLQAVKLDWGLMPIVFYSVLLWSAFALSNYFVLKAMDYHLSLVTAYYLLLFQILGVTLPSSPGFIGTYHAAVVAGLSTLGITAEKALGVAIIMHASFFFPFVLSGMAFIWAENLSFRDIRSV